TRPGEYMSIQLDSNEIPHIVWSDGRNNEMDIYYAHGIDGATIPLESIVILAGVTLILVTVVVLFIRKHQRVSAAN
ncbi:MAG: hypothetical protein ACFFEF_14645, partial [Candidatus Thorarchaeota archaeon]